MRSIMRLLIITQKVDMHDAVLGFFHRWLLEFARHAESIIVICLEEGVHALPKNVRVVSLGKEKRHSRPQHLFRFYTYLFQYRHEYDAVFVHMNPIYVVLGGLAWRLMGKKIVLWYTHRHVDAKVRIATFFAHAIVTATKESFRIETSKRHVVGHGIDVEKFVLPQRTFSDLPKILTVGRITPIKNGETLIRAAAIMRQHWGRSFSVVFIGDAVTSGDRLYERSLKEEVANAGVGDLVRFVGSIPNNEMPQQYGDADIIVNMTPTGGLDKTVIEGMASGALVLSSNTAFKPFFGQYADMLIPAYGNAEDLAGKIIEVYGRPDRANIASFLVRQAQKHFTVEAVVEKICTFLGTPTL